MIVLLLVLGAFSGSSSPPRATGTGTGSATSSSSASGTRSKHASHHAPAPATAGAASPAETNVAVLNGTETAGLAHHFATELVRLGYAKAIALGGRPSGANEATVVEYTGGHRADAASVAHALGVATVQPVGSSASALAGSANVVVVVGTDKAASVP